MKISIIIPTCNRSSLLRYALSSAIDQDPQDLEIIVSNNSSTDDTELVVDELRNQVVKYFKTDRLLSMPDHWEFALEKASGDWVLFLCDDDALLPNCISKLRELTERYPGINLFQYSYIRYNYGEERHGERTNTLQFIHPVPDEEFEIDSAAKLNSVFRNIDWDMPKFLNSMVSMRLIETIRERYGKVFWRWAPDYSSAILLMSTVSKYVNISTPLFVWGDNLASYGSGSRFDPQHYLNFLCQFEQFNGEFSYTLYPKLLTVTNGLYDTLKIMQKIIGDNENDLLIDVDNYRSMLIADIDLYLENGNQEYQEWKNIIMSDMSTKMDVSIPISRKSNYQNLKMVTRRLKNKLTRIVKEKILKSKINPREKLISGHQKPFIFTNIYEASKLFNQIKKSI